MLVRRGRSRIETSAESLQTFHRRRTKCSKNLRWSNKRVARIVMAVLRLLVMS